MRRTLYFSCIFILSIYTSIFPNNKDISRMINNTERKYKLVNDYTVKMIISVSVPAFRMPKKRYNVFFKQPDKVKIKSKGFGILPRTGMFTSPIENFNNLTNLRINTASKNLKKNQIIMAGDLIIDSLAIEMPNDYARLSFKPTVDVFIDTSKWVITDIITKIDTLKIMKIQNCYDLIDEKYFLPIESTVEYFIKDARLSKWLNKDIEMLFGNRQNIKGDLVKGLITVKYKNYQVNKGIQDSVFD